MVRRRGHVPRQAERIPVAIYERTVDGDGDRLRLADELSAAIDDGALVLHYQPQLDLHSGAVTKVEALVRWRHPELGLIPPLTFLPLAEEAGLMGKVTRWVLGEALRRSAPPGGPRAGTWRCR